MKRYLIPILLILVLASGLLAGCGHKPNWTEGQVVDSLYDYLVNKAEQLSEFDAGIQKIYINWGFEAAVLEALKETIQDLSPSSNLETINLKCSGVPVYVDSIKKLARYSGDGWWAVTISEWEWQISERTGEVKAQNEKAEELLQDITHNSYYDRTYKYEVRYPVGWKLIGLIENKAMVGSPEELVSITIAAEVYKLKVGESLGEYASGIASLSGLLAESYQLNSLKLLENGDYQAEYEYESEGKKLESRVYFKLHNSWVYMICCLAPMSLYESYLPEFDYTYSSFSFD